MPSITNLAKNENSLTNKEMIDIIVDEATMTVDEAERLVDSLGVPITKITKNEKTLVNLAENL